MTRRVASTLDEAEEFIRREQPFRLRGSGAPSLWATTEAPTYFGKIPPQHSVGAESADYWVFSYTTLIGWMTEGEPTVPDVGYSPTTGQHQYLVAGAWGLDFRPARGRTTVEIPRNHTQYGRPRRLRSGGMDGEDDRDPQGYRRRGYRDSYPPEPVATMDGSSPHRVPEEPRLHSAYHGVTGDAMHYSPTVTGEGRAHP